MLDKKYYIKRAMYKRAFNKNEAISGLIPDKLKETLLVQWAKLFAKKIGLNKLFGSGVYEFMTACTEYIQKNDDGSLNFNAGEFLDFLEEEGFREPKTQFGKALGPKLRKLTKISDFAKYIIDILVCDGTDELRKVTKIPFTPLPEEKEAAKKLGLDVSNKIPGAKYVVHTLDYIAQLEERKLAIATYMIPFLLGLIATQITLPSLFVAVATDFSSTSIKSELSKFILTLVFGSSAKRSSVLKKIWIMGIGGFFALINDLYSLVGWTTNTLISYISKFLDKSSQWLFVAYTSGISDANQHIRLLNEKERKLKEELLRKEKIETEKEFKRSIRENEKKRIRSLKKEEKDLYKRIEKIREELVPNPI